MPSIGVGEKIPLDLKLQDGNAGKYPLAYLRDVDGVSIVGSPVALTHVGEGRYIDNSIDMPDTKQLKASYIVYDDAAHTVESVIYVHGTDTFDRVSLDEILAELEAIKGVGWSGSTDTLEKIRDAIDLIIVQANATSQPEIIGEIIDETAVGEAIEDQEVDAETEGDDLDGSVETEETDATVDADPSVESEVKEC